MNTRPARPRSDPKITQRRVLLLVTGLSPQVITEALFALAVDNPDPWIPTEVEVVTTAEGAERVRLALLSDQPGWFHRLRADYDLPPIQFGPDHIHIVRDAITASRWRTSVPSPTATKPPTRSPSGCAP